LDRATPPLELGIGDRFYGLAIAFFGFIETFLMRIAHLFGSYSHTFLEREKRWLIQNLPANTLKKSESTQSNKGKAPESVTSKRPRAICRGLCGGFCKSPINLADERWSQSTL
jgi:hypothetical protein